MKKHSIKESSPFWRQLIGKVMQSVPRNVIQYCMKKLAWKLEILLGKGDRRNAHWKCLKLCPSWKCIPMQLFAILIVFIKLIRCIAWWEADMLVQTYVYEISRLHVDDCSITSYMGERKNQFAATVWGDQFFNWINRYFSMKNEIT